jgi:integrase
MNFDTPLKKELERKFTEKKLSPLSIRMYLRNLEKLNGDAPLKNLNFLKDPSAIVEKLTKYKENTKRGYLISITSALSLDTSTKQKKKLHEDYFKLMMDKNKEIKDGEATNSNQKSEQQEKNWLTWSEVEKKAGELKEKVDAFSSKELNEHNYNILLAYQVLALYTLCPPRRNEYQHLRLVKSGAQSLPTDTNYVDYDGKVFVYNKFKTSKKEGQVVLPIPDELYKVIQKYLKYHPLLKGKKVIKTTNVPFLVYYDGSALDKVNSITRILNKIFGKSVGSSMLRHIYLSEKYGDVRKDMKDDAKAMSHSVSTQQNTYVKTDSPEQK